MFNFGEACAEVDSLIQIMDDNIEQIRDGIKQIKKGRRDVTSAMNATDQIKIRSVHASACMVVAGTTGLVGALYSREPLGDGTPISHLAECMNKAMGMFRAEEGNVRVEVSADS